MKNNFRILFALLLISFFLKIKAQDVELTNYVDPFWGAAEHLWIGGHTFAGAAMPFGMVKLGPDCNEMNTNSGYDRKGKIHGFSHVHVSGSGGNPKYGNVLVMATSGNLNIKNYGSERANEVASPGYFSVDYSTYNIHSEFSVTQSVGFHKYQFNKGGESNILFDLGSYLIWPGDLSWTQELVGSEVKINSKSELQGYTRVRRGWGQGSAYTVFFYAVLDTPADKIGTWKSGIQHDGAISQSDTNEPVGAYFTFNSKQGQVVKLKVGISYLGVEKAKENLMTEANHWDFEKTRSDAKLAWNKELNKIQIENNNEVTKSIFYSALYHALLQPTNRTGENPNWKSNRPYYDDYFCIWDTFRATHPLFTLIDEKRQVDMVNTLLDIYENEGYMPDAWSGNSYAMTQGGSNSDVMIADAFVKGLKGIDYELALKAMLQNAEVAPGGNEEHKGRGGLSSYNSLGYVSNDFVRSGSRTMEYAFNDYCIATVAKGLGNKEVYDKYSKKANNWKNIWYSGVEHEGAKGFILPRKKDGNWVLNQNLNEAGGLMGWTYEGNSWEYSLYVPHDVAELIHYCGGSKMFEQRLDTFFTKQGKSFSQYTNDYFNISNEPGFLAPLLYNYIGKPYKSSVLVRKILAENFKTGLDGLPGNEDSGSMSSWFVFHSMGFYPIAGTDIYLISSPLNSRSTMKLGENKKLTIIAKGLSDKNIFIRSATLNGKPLNRSWFRHGEIINGGILEFTMDSKISDWGTRELPPSMSGR